MCKVVLYLMHDRPVSLRSLQGLTMLNLMMVKLVVHKLYVSVIAGGRFEEILWSQICDLFFREEIWFACN